MSLGHLVIKLGGEPGCWDCSSLWATFPVAQFPLEVLMGSKSLKDKHVALHQHLLRKHGLVKAFNQFLWYTTV